MRKERRRATHRLTSLEGQVALLHEILAEVQYDAPVSRGLRWIARERLMDLFYGSRRPSRIGVLRQYDRLKRWMRQRDLVRKVSAELMELASEGRPPAVFDLVTIRSWIDEHEPLLEKRRERELLIEERALSRAPKRCTGTSWSRGRWYRCIHPALRGYQRCKRCVDRRQRRAERARLKRRALRDNNKRAGKSQPPPNLEADGGSPCDQS